MEGRVALVTGAGRGIGQAMAGWMADAGAQVVICSRSADQLAAAAEAIERRGGTVLAMTCDVTEPGAIDQLVAAALTRFGRVDIAVANAAQLGPVGSISSIDLDQFADTLRLNVGSVAALAQAVVPIMATQGFGRILTMSGGGVGGPNLPERVSSYVASKGAVLLLTEVLAFELAAGVTINAIAPGAVPTGFMDDVLAAGPAVAGDSLFAAVQETVMPDLDPLRDLVMYLAGVGSGWLSGRCLSARWDTPAELERARSAGIAQSRYRMRRIDEDLYADNAAVAT